MLIFQSFLFPQLILEQLQPEIENLVTKPLEEAIITISGIEKLQSRSRKDTSQITIQLYQGIDAKHVEQQVRDKINQTKSAIPEDINESVIRHVDPSDQPILTIRRALHQELVWEKC